MSTTPVTLWQADVQNLRIREGKSVRFLRKFPDVVPMRVLLDLGGQIRVEDKTANFGAEEWRPCPSRILKTYALTEALKKATIHHLKEK